MPAELPPNLTTTQLQVFSSAEGIRQRPPPAFINLAARNAFPPSNSPSLAFTTSHLLPLLVRDVSPPSSRISPPSRIPHLLVPYWRRRRNLVASFPRHARSPFPILALRGATTEERRIARPTLRRLGAANCIPRTGCTMGMEA